LLAQLFGIASRYVAAKSKALALHIQEQKNPMLPPDCIVC